MRSATVISRVVCVAAFLGTVGWSRTAGAQIAAGEWARTDAGGGGMTMTVASCCNNGYRLTYHIPIKGGQPLVVVERFTSRVDKGRSQPLATSASRPSA